MTASTTTRRPAALFNITTKGFEGDTKKGPCLYAPTGVGTSTRYSYFYNAVAPFQPVGEASRSSKSLAEYLVTMTAAQCRKHGIDTESMTAINEDVLKAFDEAAPMVEAPMVEATEVEAPIAEAPVAEAPVAEAPEVEAVPAPKAKKGKKSRK